MTTSGIRKRYVGLGIAIAALAPWPIAWVGTRADRTAWACTANLEFATHSDKRLIRIWGLMESEYRQDGTGFARFSGFLRGNPEQAPPSRVHRAIEFDYQSLGSLVRVHTTRATRLMGDTADDGTLYRFLMPGLAPGHTDYFQTMRAGEDVVAAFNGQPRVFCARPSQTLKTPTPEPHPE